MKDEIIDAYLKEKESGATEFWPKLMKQFGYVKKEKIRSVVRRGLKERGLEVENNIVERAESSSPKIGIVDLEVLPNICYTWGFYDQNVAVNQIVSPLCFLSFAGMYLDESRVYSDILTPDEARGRDEKRITGASWSFLSKCDVVVGHNIINYDNKIFNTLFLKYGLPPLSYKLVDTLVIAKNNFRFQKNSLEYINKQLGIKQKLETEGFLLWSECDRGNPEYLAKMLDYNIGDVYATLDLFYQFRPYIKNVNVSLYNSDETSQCPCCGSTELESEGAYYTTVAKYESMRCLKCGAISRKKQNMLSKEKRSMTLVKV
jgi:hypothetical protein